MEFGGGRLNAELRYLFGRLLEQVGYPERAAEHLSRDSETRIRTGIRLPSCTASSSCQCCASLAEPATECSVIGAGCFHGGSLSTRASQILPFTTFPKLFSPLTPSPSTRPLRPPPWPHNPSANLSRNELLQRPSIRRRCPDGLDPPNQTRRSRIHPREAKPGTPRASAAKHTPRVSTPRDPKGRTSRASAAKRTSNTAFSPNMSSSKRSPRRTSTSSPPSSMTSSNLPTPWPACWSMISSRPIGGACGSAASNPKSSMSPSMTASPSPSTKGTRWRKPSVTSPASRGCCIC